jgi:hypothetical protein
MIYHQLLFETQNSKHDLSNYIINIFILILCRCLRFFIGRNYHLRKDVFGI